MALNKQIHLYNLDTACFYTESENKIHKKLNRCYFIRTKIKKNKKSNIKKNINLKKYNHQLRRINKIIDDYKNKLYEEFKKTASLKIMRQLRSEYLNDKNVISIFESNLTRTLKFKTNELTDNIFVIQVYYFQVAEELIKNGFLYNNEKYILFENN